MARPRLGKEKNGPILRLLVWLVVSPIVRLIVTPIVRLIVRLFVTPIVRLILPPKARLGIETRFVVAITRR